MLERTAGCLESGTLRRLLSSSKPPLKSRRTLHSAFWNHATGDLELSPLWVALVRGSDLEQGHAATLRRSSNVNGGLFLDFLYPAGTINFLRNYSRWILHRQNYFHGRAGLSKPGQRLYSSSRNASTNEFAALTTYDTEALGFEGDASRTQLLRSKLGIDGAYDCDETWRNYLLLSDADKTLVRGFLIHYYSTSKRVLESERIVDLFNELDPQDRDTRAYYYAIRAHLKLQKLDDAYQLHETALTTLNAPAGSAQLVAYLITRSFWVPACTIWSSFNQLLERNPYISYNIYGVLEKQPNYRNLVCQLAEFANNTLQDPTRNPNEGRPVIVDFAKGLAERILLDRTSPNSTEFATLVGYLHQWDALSPEIFQKAVYILYDMNQRQAIVQWYRLLRKKDFIFTRQTLHKILRIFCEGDSIRGMQQILDDFFHHYKKPTITAYNVCMTKFAARGDAKTVHALFDQFLDHHTSQEKPLDDPSYLTPILQAHSKRGEIAEVVKTFDDISNKYGLHPSVICWNILISAYGKVHDVDNAFVSFESLLDSPGLKPDAYTLATLMGIAVSRGDYERVIEIDQMADDLKIFRNYAMADCVVQAHIQNNDLLGAERVCKEVAKSDLGGNRTRMWNYLIVAYALRRDLPNANRILKQMSSHGASKDGYTYAALMQALAMVCQPYQAHNILKKVLPRVGIKPTSFHYAIIMGAYLAVGEVHKIPPLYEELTKRDIPQSASTNLLLLKATTRPDPRPTHQITEDERFQRAMEMFLDIAMNPPEVSGGAEKGVTLPLDTAYPTSLYSYIIYVAGQGKEFGTVQELYERYQKAVPEDRQKDPPLRIISALMAAKWQERDIAGVQEYWKLAISKAEADSRQLRFKRTFPSGSPISKDSVEIPAHHKLDLTKCLSFYLESLSIEGNANQMVYTVDDLLKRGFVLDNHNWNTYVRVLCAQSSFKLAFEICENRLMSGFTGWARARHRLPVRKRLPIEIRNLRKNSSHLRPMSHTMMTLANAYLTLQESALESVESQHLMEDIRVSCRKTLAAIETMEHDQDPMEELIMRRA